MTKYLFVFSATYLLALLCFFVISNQYGLSGSGNITTLLASAVVAGGSFISDKGRTPTKSEKRALVWGSYLSAIVISGVLMFGLLALSQDGQATIRTLLQIQLWIWVLSIAVITLVSILVLSFSYGWLSRKLFAAKIN